MLDALPRLAFVGQEVPADPLEHRSNHRLRLVAQAAASRRTSRRNSAVARMGVRSRPPGTRRGRRESPAATSPSAAAASRQICSAVEIARAAREEAVERVPGDQPPIEQRGQAVARAARCRAAPAPARRRDRSRAMADQDPHRPIERRGDEPRHLGLVGEIEGRIDVRLERELAQQRQAERVDGADGDVAEPIAQIQPARADRAPIARAAPRSSRRMRSRISAAALRVNVIARMLAGSTPAFSRLT